MPHLYRLGNPGVAAISHDGREYRVNGDGLLEIDEAHMTPALHQEIMRNFAGQQHEPDAAPPLMSAEEQERQILFTRLDAIFNRRIDRRRSLQQLKEMLADHEARQARTEGATTALASGAAAPDSAEAPPAS
jgi:hypothetical protein